MTECVTDILSILSEIEAAYLREGRSAKEGLRAQYVGLRAAFDLLAEEIREDDSGRPFLVLVPPDNPKAGTVLAYFPEAEASRVRGFPLGARATVEGRITRVVRGGLFLEDCRVAGGDGS